MSIKLPGYEIVESIHEGWNTVIYRANYLPTANTVIIKTLKAEYPTLEDISRLRHEYKILQPLNLEGVIKPLALENYQNGLALILEDFGQPSLKWFISNNSINLTEFLQIAIQVVAALEKIHQKNIIHKDIKPHNILVASRLDEIKIIDFSIATRLSRENAAYSSLNLLEGTLAYISPEQTGRMNRYIDYRTDFYSLGATFYEILTGQLPFVTEDPMELVHCHIAKQPVAPHQLNPEIPLAISSIIMKLLAKNAEDRYQSAAGILVDLEDCLTQLQNTGKIADFSPGQRDKSGQFLIPQKLYGREIEVEKLMTAFERVSTGTSEMMLVSGYSGIGKSSLVYEIHKPIVGQRGYFIAGKFDQFKRNIPHAALIQAFSELIRQLLTENATQIAKWKEQLLNALGENGQIIIDVIPQVELIIGSQPQVPQLEPTESQNRFNRVFQEFIHVFAQQFHPLVLFLDDLQWADSASLKLIQLLITDVDSQYLLMIGAYRNNETSPTHPLIITLDEINNSGATLNNIILQPLVLNTVNQLVSDTLGDSERTKTLSELLFNKTQGNPFFLTQLLQTLYAEKFLQFDFTEGRWLWDLEQIQAIGITDYNVVELIARNIQKLSDDTQKVIKLAACIGNQFNLEVLAIVSEKSLLTTADELWDALQAGLILPLSNAYKIPLFFDDNEQGNLHLDEYKVSYKFLHDRVQQAAYSLIPEEQKKATHLKIGQLLLQKTAKYALEEHILDIVNQLNIGKELITKSAENYELAKLNLIAGKKAKIATAYEAAVKYFTVSLELLGENNWQSDYNLMLELYVEAAEAEYLNINFKQAIALTKIAQEKAKNLLDQVKVYELEMQICIAQLEMLKAIDIGLQVLDKLRTPLFTIQGEESFNFNLPQLEELDNMPEMTDVYKLSVMRILKILCAPAFQAKPEIFPQLILTMINLCIENGNSALSAFAYGFYGLLMSGTGKLDAGYQAGLIAIKILEKFDAKELKAKVYNLFNSNIRTWKEHAKNSIAPLQEGVQSGLETGDIEWGGYCAANFCAYTYFTEENLENAVQKQATYLDLTRKIKQEIPIHFSSVWRQLGLNFQGLTNDNCLLIGESFDESEMLPRLIAAKTGTVLFVFYIAKTILSYQFNKYEKALEYADLATEQAGSAFGFMQVAILNFYHSLALLSNYQQVSATEQKKYLELVETNQEKMKYWATHAPINYLHKYLLVEAEKARVLGEVLAAMECYDAAIQGAKEQRYKQEEAIANELAAEFYLALGRERIAKTYMTEAYYVYIAWGAISKVKDLERKYAHLISRSTKQEVTDIATTRTSNSTTRSVTIALDLATVMEASQAISGEIIFTGLLDKLIKSVIENAGAQRGILLLKQDRQWLLEAEGIVTDEGITVTQHGFDYSEDNLPITVINYVEMTQESLVLENATVSVIFANDTYILEKKPKSILCTPVIYKGNLTGMIILENYLSPGVFNAQRVEIIKSLSAQIAVSLENARIYQKEQEKTQLLEQSLAKLQTTQNHLFQVEKISSLGQLVAGVTHEINNYINFISGNLYHTNQYLQDLLNLIELYQQEHSSPSSIIEEELEAIELDYIVTDLPKILNSMQLGTERIREVTQTLRNFSRIDETEKKLVDIHVGINNTLIILDQRLKAKPDRPAIQVIKEYGELPLVECYAGQLNQVFMNILSNAIDAIEQQNIGRTFVEIQQNPNIIIIRTKLLNDQCVSISIKDNGLGMSEAVQKRLFEPFFTTKPVGKGTGFGLSISREIVLEKHGGNFQCVSAPGEGTEFIVQLPIKQGK
ncbi:AAA family ATPase [Phormidium sp. LEGE 05292]|uniref:trifunctional serine/threonine-protein kinase/ATP-binding protein/sensor histidine kinase n=1 Tax=[Phormidium] sp. LEGE 05292 TaxID=767427 RepID=UPI00188141B8|nr:AAA family ATPase [Phormidium sp. LEGE 05292]MBE9226544.1 AAA family ATPase [Phormidium sp. LEGE 05292]